jgi:hypothetical protein
VFFVFLWEGILLILFWPAAARPLLQRALVRHGAATAGAITAKETQTSKGTTYYKVRYRYWTPPLPADGALPTDEAAGRDRERTMAVEEDDYATVAVGACVTVLYSRRWPRWSVVYRCAPYQALPPEAGPPSPGRP